MRVWSWLVLGALTLAVLLGGVALLHSRTPQSARSPYEGGATLTQLKALPETNLFYPDSEIVVRLGREDMGLFAGRNPSYTGYDLATNASEDEILAFYTRELHGHGWQALGGLYSTSSTAERIARSWRKGDRIFRFAIKEEKRSTGAACRYRRSLHHRLQHPNP